MTPPATSKSKLEKVFTFLPSVTALIVAATALLKTCGFDKTINSQDKLINEQKVQIQIQWDSITAFSKQIHLNINGDNNETNTTGDISSQGSVKVGSETTTNNYEKPTVKKPSKK